jgi:hypothetical protein
MGFPYFLAASTEQYFPGAQSSSLMVNSGDGAFGAFRCRIYILKRLTQSLNVVSLADFLHYLYVYISCLKVLAHDDYVAVCWSPSCCCSSAHSSAPRKPRPYQVALSLRPFQLGLDAQQSLPSVHSTLAPVR